MISPKMRNSIAGVVTLVWAVNVVAGLVVHDYKPDANINAIFMAVVGSLFASSISSKEKGPKDEETTLEDVWPEESTRRSSREKRRALEDD